MPYESNTERDLLPLLFDSWLPRKEKSIRPLSQIRDRRMVTLSITYFG